MKKWTEEAPENDGNFFTEGANLACRNSAKRI